MMIHSNATQDFFAKEQQDILKPMILKVLDIGKDLNDGHGLAVPPSLADNLKNMGITDGYTVVKPLPPATVTPATAPGEAQQSREAGAQLEKDKA